MIDTSKAVRPCVEELAKQINNSIAKTSTPFPDYCKYENVASRFKQGTFTEKGITYTNNNDGSITINAGTKQAGSVVYTLDGIEIECNAAPQYYSSVSGNPVVRPFAFVYSFAFSEPLPSGFGLGLSISYVARLDGEIAIQTTKGSSPNVFSPITFTAPTIALNSDRKDYVFDTPKVSIFSYSSRQIPITSPIRVSLTPILDAASLFGFESIESVYNAINPVTGVSQNDIVNNILSLRPSLLNEINDMHFEDAMHAHFDTFNVVQTDSVLKIYNFS